jgi:hypothetical protein
VESVSDIGVTYVDGFLKGGSGWVFLSRGWFRVVI